MITPPVSQRHRNGPVAGLDVMGRFPIEPRLGALYGAGNGLPVDECHSHAEKNRKNQGKNRKEDVTGRDVRFSVDLNSNEAEIRAEKWLQQLDSNQRPSG